jgi:hypothetical protein
VRDAYTARIGHGADYAQIPDVVLDSPKMKAERTTRWFAENVDRRYQACLQKPIN